MGRRGKRYKPKPRKKEGFMQAVLALMFSQVLIKILGLVYNLYLTNKPGYGDEGNAISGGAYQIYALLLTVSSIGVPNAISKLVSARTAIGDNRGAHRIFKVAFVTFSFIGLIGSALLFFGAGFIANKMLEIPEAELTLVALSPAIFFVAISSVIRGYFNGKENMRATANSQTLEQLFKTTLTIGLVSAVSVISNANTVLMAAAANLATTFSIFLSFSYLYIFLIYKRREMWQDIKSSTVKRKESIFSIIKKILFTSIPMALSSMMSAINKNIDSFTVVRSLKEFMPENEAKAQYGILGGKVDTLTSLPLSFNIAFATALVPAISAAMAKKDFKTAQKRVSFSLLITMLIGLPCTVGMFIFAEPILILLYPNANEGELILQISSLTVIFTVLAQTVNGALQGFGKIMVPAIALRCRSLCKIHFKFSFSTNTMDWSMWCSNRFCCVSYDIIYNRIYCVKKKYKIKSWSRKILYKTNYMYCNDGDMLICIVYVFKWNYCRKISICNCDDFSCYYIYIIYISSKSFK